MLSPEEIIKKHYELRSLISIYPKIDISNLEELALWYTPGVGEISKLLVKEPHEDRQLTLRGNAVAVISDGSAVLGLGNIGPTGGLPVMEGKALLFKALAGVDAYPIVLDTQDPEEIIKTVKILAKNFAGINLEDISAPKCFAIEERLRAELDIPVVHDDQHATAIVTLAGIYNACKITDRELADSKIVINGMGAAGTAVAKLLFQAGVRNFILLDSKGSITNNRKDLNSEKLALVKYFNLNQETLTLQEALVGADIFIGLSVGNLLASDDIKKMQKNPIVFAMANPTPEILPSQAILGGAKAIATGRSDFPNQINNVLVFPGLFRGLIDNNILKLTDEMKIAIAQALSELVDSPTPDKFVPDILDPMVVSTIVKTLSKFA